MNDAAVLRRHLSQILFKEPSVPNIHLYYSQMENKYSCGLTTDVPAIGSISATPVSLRKSVEQASQNNEGFLRLNRCDDSTCKSRDTTCWDFTIGCERDQTRINTMHPIILYCDFSAMTNYIIYI